MLLEMTVPGHKTALLSTLLGLAVLPKTYLFIYLRWVQELGLVVFHVKIFWKNLENIFFLKMKGTIGDSLQNFFLLC